MAQLCLRFARGGAGGGVIGRAGAIPVSRASCPRATTSYLCSTLRRGLSTDSSSTPEQDGDSTASQSSEQSSASIDNFDSLQEDLEGKQVTHDDGTPRESAAAFLDAVDAEDAVPSQRSIPKTFSKGRLLFPYVPSKVPQVVKDLPASQKEIDHQRRLDWIVPKHFRVRPTECVHCVLYKQEKMGERVNDFYRINKTNVRLLTNYVNDRGMILPRRITALCRKHQRHARTAIINSRQMGLMPYTSKLKFVKLDKDPSDDFLQQELSVLATDTLKRLSNIAGAHDPADEAESFVRGDGGGEGLDAFGTNPLADKKQSRALEKTVKRAR